MKWPKHCLTLLPKQNVLWQMRSNRETFGNNNWECQLALTSIMAKRRCPRCVRVWLGVCVCVCAMQSGKFCFVGFWAKLDLHSSAGKREKSPEVWQRRRQRKNARKTRINFIVKIVFNLSHCHLYTCMCVCVWVRLCLQGNESTKRKKEKRKREKRQSRRAKGKRNSSWWAWQVNLFKEARNCCCCCCCHDTPWMNG